MTRAERQRRARNALELIEEAVHLLRTAPVGALATYFVGTLPFVLGLLFFWADMSESAFASRHAVDAALGVAALFLWMKFWQAIFAQQLHARMAGRPAPPLDFARCRRVFISQALLQPTGLFLLPLASVPVLPLPWVYAFYQNVTVLDDGSAPNTRGVIAKAGRHAGLWPRQNWLLLTIMSGFGLFVFLDIVSAGYMLPQLLKMLLGIESVFSMSGTSLLNSTFFAIAAGLAYLCVDPVLKAIYALRCFYGESLTTGEDLKAEVAGFAAARGMAIAAGIVMAVGLLGGEIQKTSNIEIPMFDVISLATTASAPDPSKTPIERSAPVSSASPQQPESVSPPDLDHALDHVIHERKYAWRMPREKDAESDSGKEGIIQRFLDGVWNKLEEWAKGFFNWLGRVLRKLFNGGGGSFLPNSSGYGWIMLLEILLYGLAIVAACVLVYLIFRAIQNRERSGSIVAAVPIRPAPDLTSEDVGAEQLPEDGWVTLAREFLARGEFRLAVRAFYLSSLAHLAERNLISLARFKSNRDYERELRRRGHSFAELPALFGENVSIFDGIWYGMHEVNADLVTQFAARVERIKGTG